LLALLGVTTALIALDLVLVPWLLSATVGYPFFLKLLLSAVVLIPLGFLMGMPFPQVSG
jgi:hypothetical protein